MTLAVKLHFSKIETSTLKAQEIRNNGKSNDNSNFATIMTEMIEKSIS